MTKLSAANLDTYFVNHQKIEQIDEREEKILWMKSVEMLQIMEVLNEKFQQLFQHIKISLSQIDQVNYWLCLNLINQATLSVFISNETKILYSQKNSINLKKSAVIDSFSKTQTQISIVKKILNHAENVSTAEWKQFWILMMNLNCVMTSASFYKKSCVLLDLKLIFLKIDTDKSELITLYSWQIMIII